MSEKIKRFIDCVLPVYTCNLKCHYCCITINKQSTAKLPNLIEQAKLIGEALSIKRLGGPCIVNICGFGETLLVPEVTLFIENLLKAGHYVMVVTNGTVKKRFEEIIKLNPDLLQRLFFKFSFHYLELIRTKQLDVFFDNIQKIKDAGCSFSLEMTPNDEIIPQIDEIKKICLERVGAICHLTVARDGHKPDLPLLTKLSQKEYKQIWSEFDSKMFEYKLSAFGKKNKHFCYAGDWTLFVNLGSGELKQCYQGKTLCSNIYENMECPLNFEAIGFGCMEPHCYNAHAFLTFGTVPNLNTPTYLDMRDRVCINGEHWVNDIMKGCFSQKLKDNNDEYSLYKKAEVNIRNMCKNKFVQNIFSVTNSDDNHKIIRILGIKIKIKYDKNKYSNKYKKELRAAYHLLKDRESKRVFNARVKYLDTYDIKRNKIPASKYEEYHHPKVPVKNGDIIIDAGVSEWLEPTILFSKKVGDSGLVIGFEPEPNGFEEAKRQINKLNIKNIKLENVGLWDKDDTLKITQLGRGSSFFWGAENAQTIDCMLTSLDKYVAENNIQKINFIKMDIEGAEINALKGSERTIICNRPNLAICVYHKPEHLFEIIFYLNSLNLGYKFYLGHHRDNEFSTVLYATYSMR